MLVKVKKMESLKCSIDKKKKTEKERKENKEQLENNQQDQISI